MNKFLFSILVIFLLATIVFISTKLSIKETFEASYRPIHLQPYADKFYNRNTNIVPMEILPSEFQEIEYRDKSNGLKHYPIDSSNSYCKEHPGCYPCPGWKMMGNPMCH
jgi:hypothetical protein